MGSSPRIDSRTPLRGTIISLNLRAMGRQSVIANENNHLLCTLKRGRCTATATSTIDGILLLHTAFSLRPFIPRMPMQCVLQQKDDKGTKCANAIVTLAIAIAVFLDAAPWSRIWYTNPRRTGPLVELTSGFLEPGSTKGLVLRGCRAAAIRSVF